VPKDNGKVSILTGGSDTSRLAQKFSEGVALRNINNQ
jgi:hypothetical protein